MTRQPRPGLATARAAWSMPSILITASAVVALNLVISYAVARSAFYSAKQKLVEARLV